APAEPPGLRRERGRHRRPPPRPRRLHALALVVGGSGGRTLPPRARGRPPGLELPARRRPPRPAPPGPSDHAGPRALPHPRRDLQGALDLAAGRGPPRDRRPDE